MGVGKSTVGRAISEQSFMSLVDLDRLVEINVGMSVSEIFAKKSEHFFRVRESELFRTHLYLNDHFVMATGGGTPCFEDNLKMMLKAGVVVWLDLPTHKIIERLQLDPESRPLISGMGELELEEFVTESLAQREQYYSQAHIKVQSDDKLNIKDLVGKITSYSK